MCRLLFVACALLIHGKFNYTRVYHTVSVDGREPVSAGSPQYMLSMSRRIKSVNDDHHL